MVLGQGSGGGPSGQGGMGTSAGSGAPAVRDGSPAGAVGGGPPAGPGTINSGIGGTQPSPPVSGLAQTPLAPAEVRGVAEQAPSSTTGLARPAEDGVSTNTVSAKPCSTAAKETDGTTTCVGIPVREMIRSVFAALILLG